MEKETNNEIKINRIIVGVLNTNCYLVSFGEEAIVIDAGADAEKIIEEARLRGVKIKKIFNTHGHFDHRLANKKLQKITNAELVGNLKEGDNVKIGKDGLKVISTPGHTKDSVIFLGKNFLISGDLLFLEGHGRTDLPGGSQDDMEKTIKRVIEKVGDDSVIYPGHGEPFTMREWKESIPNNLKS